MSGDTELLVFRLGLIAVVLLFVLAASLSMRAGLTSATRQPRRRAAAPVTGPRLVVEATGRTGLEPGTAFALAGVMSIGRDGRSGIVLADPSVSGRHATIEQVAGGWRLADAGSTNGTFVDGRLVDGRGAVLHGGERIAVGAVGLRLQL